MTSATEFDLRQVFDDESSDESRHDVADPTSYPPDLSERLSPFKTDEIWEELRRREQLSFDLTDTNDAALLDHGNSDRNTNAAEALVQLRETINAHNVFDNNIYEVECICDKKVCDGKAYYFVKWSGYPHSQNTWEPKDNLLGPDAQKLAGEFEKSSV